MPANSNVSGKYMRNGFKGGLAPARFAREVLRKIGFDLVHHTVISDHIRSLISFAERDGVGLIIDVGGNAGQFAQKLLDKGWKGRIISVEPLADAHAKLVQASTNISAWTIARRVALGSSKGSAIINVAGNSQSSSILPMNELHLQAAPESLYVSQQEIEVLTVADLLEEMGVTERYALKMDVQGFEMEVLRGASDTLDRCGIVFSEMSLSSCYAGETLFDELSLYIRSQGFRCVGVSPSYYDRKTGETLQIDGTFIRDTQAPV